MSSGTYEPVRKLAGSDAVESFDCGHASDPFHLFLLMKDLKAIVSG